MMRAADIGLTLAAIGMAATMAVAILAAPPSAASVWGLAAAVAAIALLLSVVRGVRR